MATHQIWKGAFPPPHTLMPGMGHGDVMCDGSYSSLTAVKHGKQNVIGQLKPPASLPAHVESGEGLHIGREQSSPGWVCVGLGECEYG